MVFRTRAKEYKEHPAQCLVQVSIQQIVGKLMVAVIDRLMPEGSSTFPESLSSMNLVT